MAAKCGCRKLGRIGAASQAPLEPHAALHSAIVAFVQQFLIVLCMFADLSKLRSGLWFGELHTTQVGSLEIVKGPQNMGLT
jgi:hypothetical protein